MQNITTISRKKIHNARKVSVFEVIPVRIFLHVYGEITPNIDTFYTVDNYGAFIQDSGFDSPIMSARNHCF